MTWTFHTASKYGKCHMITPNVLLLFLNWCSSKKALLKWRVEDNVSKTFLLVFDFWEVIQSFFEVWLPQIKWTFCAKSLGFILDLFIFRKLDIVHFRALFCTSVTQEQIIKKYIYISTLIVKYFLFNWTFLKIIYM